MLWLLTLLSLFNQLALHTGVASINLASLFLTRSLYNRFPRNFDAQCSVATPLTQTASSTAAALDYSDSTVETKCVGGHCQAGMNRPIALLPLSLLLHKINQPN